MHLSERFNHRRRVDPPSAEQAGARGSPTPRRHLLSPREDPHEEDALQATRAALEEGIVPGGGGALLNAAKSVETPAEGIVQLLADRGH